MQKEIPVGLSDSDAKFVQEEVSVVLTDSNAECVSKKVPVLSAEEKMKIEEITTETLNDLEMLGGEVFDQSPVSVYFDDWFVHLRQVILGFESNDVINVDEAFTNECEQIFNDIEEELAKIQQIKTLNPLKKIAKEQKRSQVTQKLNATKQRLALAAQNSGVEQKKIHAEYEKKKQNTIKKMHKLEKEIASKKTDGSLEARKAATKALANAVKSRIQRKTAPSQ